MATQISPLAVVDPKAEIDLDVQIEVLRRQLEREGIN